MSSAEFAAVVEAHLRINRRDSDDLEHEQFQHNRFDPWLGELRLLVRPSDNDAAAQ